MHVRHGRQRLIHLYSIGYMKGDSEYPKFFLYLNLFVFSMVLLVLSNNLLVTFIGWEGVGVCSYWWSCRERARDSAASAGKKAFLYNRVGDAGFLIAMFLIFSKLGTLDLPSIFAHRHAGRQGHRGGPAAAPRGDREVARRSRCSTGCPTPWRARPRSPP